MEEGGLGDEAFFFGWYGLYDLGFLDLLVV